MELKFVSDGSICNNYMSADDYFVADSLADKLNAFIGTKKLEDTLEKCLEYAELDICLPDDNVDKAMYMVACEYALVESWSPTLESSFYESVYTACTNFGVINDDTNEESFTEFIGEVHQMLSSITSILHNDNGDAIGYAGFAGWNESNDSSTITMAFGFFKENERYFGEFPLHDIGDISEKYGANYEDKFVPIPLHISPIYPLPEHISTALTCSIIISYITGDNYSRTDVINDLKAKSNYTNNTSALTYDTMEKITSRQWVEHLALGESMVSSMGSIISLLGYDDSTNTLFYLSSV